MKIYVVIDRDFNMSGERLWAFRKYKDAHKKLMNIPLKHRSMLYPLWL